MTNRSINFFEQLKHANNAQYFNLNDKPMPYTLGWLKRRRSHDALT